MSHEDGSLITAPRPAAPVVPPLAIPPGGFPAAPDAAVSQRHAKRVRQLQLLHEVQAEIDGLLAQHAQLAQIPRVFPHSAREPRAPRGVGEEALPDSWDALHDRLSVGDWSVTGPQAPQSARKAPRRTDEWSSDGTNGRGRDRHVRDESLTTRDHGVAHRRRATAKTPFTSASSSSAKTVVTDIWRPGEVRAVSPSSVDGRGSEDDEVDDDDVDDEKDRAAAPSPLPPEWISEFRSLTPVLAPDRPPAFPVGGALRSRPDPWRLLHHLHEAEAREVEAQRPPPSLRRPPSHPPTPPASASSTAMSPTASASSSAASAASVAAAAATAPLTASSSASLAPNSLASSSSFFVGHTSPVPGAPPRLGERGLVVGDTADSGPASAPAPTTRTEASVDPPRTATTGFPSHVPNPRSSTRGDGRAFSFSSVRVDGELGSDLGSGVGLGDASGAFPSAAPRPPPPEPEVDVRSILLRDWRFRKLLGERGGRRGSGAHDVAVRDPGDDDLFTVRRQVSGNTAGTNADSDSDSLDSDSDSLDSDSGSDSGSRGGGGRRFEDGAISPVPTPLGTKRPTAGLHRRRQKLATTGSRLNLPRLGSGLSLGAVAELEHKRQLLREADAMRARLSKLPTVPTPRRGPKRGSGGAARSSSPERGLGTGPGSHRMRGGASGDGLSASSSASGLWRPAGWRPWKMRPRWRWLQEIEAKGLAVAPSSIDPAIVLRGRRLLRASVFAIHFLLYLVWGFREKRIATRRTEMQTFIESLGWYTELTKSWLARLVAVPVTSLLSAASSSAPEVADADEPWEADDGLSVDLSPWPPVPLLERVVPWLRDRGLHDRSLETRSRRLKVRVHAILDALLDSVLPDGVAPHTAHPPASHGARAPRMSASAAAGAAGGGAMGASSTSAPPAASVSAPPVRRSADLIPVPDQLLSFLDRMTTDRIYFPTSFLFAAERAMLTFDSLYASRLMRPFTVLPNVLLAPGSTPTFLADGERLGLSSASHGRASAPRKSLPLTSPDPVSAAGLAAAAADASRAHRKASSKSKEVPVAALVARQGWLMTQFEHRPIGLVRARAMEGILGDTSTCEVVIAHFVIAKVLVPRVLMTPHLCGIVGAEPGPAARRNLRVLASTFWLLLRRIFPALAPGRFSPAAAAAAIRNGTRRGVSGRLGGRMRTGSVDVSGGAGSPRSSPAVDGSDGVPPSGGSSAAAAAAAAAARAGAGGGSAPTPGAKALGVGGTARTPSEAAIADQLFNEEYFRASEEFTQEWLLEEELRLRTWIALLLRRVLLSAHAPPEAIASIFAGLNPGAAGGGGGGGGTSSGVVPPAIRSESGTSTTSGVPHRVSSTRDRPAGSSSASPAGAPAGAHPPPGFSSVASAVGRVASSSVRGHVVLDERGAPIPPPAPRGLRPQPPAAVRLLSGDSGSSAAGGVHTGPSPAAGGGGASLAASSPAVGPRTRRVRLAEG